MVNCLSLASTVAVMCVAQLRLLEVGLCRCGVASMYSHQSGHGIESLPLSGLLLVSLLGAGVAFCYWCV
jgi:hypothetical protein